MRRRTHAAAAAVASAAVAAVTATLLAGPAGPAGASGPVERQRAAEDVVVGHAADHLPNQTAEDWVTHADHVIVVSAVSERQIPPTQQELDRGEGVIGRNVTLRIDEVLWSRDGAPKPAPRTWDYSAVGWQFTDGDTGNRTELAMHDRPRVEVGHTYIMAVVWEQARCSPGDPEAPAQWRGLGEGSEIPYDTGVIGTGEQEGRTQRADEAATAVARGTEAGADDGLEERLAGREAAELVAELKAARPGDTRQRAAATAAETGCG
ncbi:hypothetical protein V1L54_24005 [Streptomyces sp. TRM 70361]|uniref:hypothetical protein n=1 Tax=Streptomyces sp. TRM 70361 TaxID=3116553 RepID=UPI002E7BC61E|nr:hypothetical protein [Streptomyces sp. TRM 70361]MEE1942428.1 hypothetical protein [Streptomyces sp. TRM 70361]